MTNRRFGDEIVAQLYSLPTEAAIEIIDFVISHGADYRSKIQLKMAACVRAKSALIAGEKMDPADADHMNDLMAIMFEHDHNTAARAFKDLEGFNGKAE